MTRRGGWVLRVLQLSLLAAVLWLTASRLAPQWSAFRAAGGSIRPDALLVLGSAVCVLLLYAVQIHAWRTLVSAWGRRLPFISAARVWSVSNLARFAPASPLVTTGSMSVLGSRAGVPAAAAAGAAVLGTLLNLVAGLVVLVVTGAGLVAVLAPSVPKLAVPVLALVAAIALVALPLAVRPGAALLGRVFGRQVNLPSMPGPVVWTAVTANLAAWLLYGLAFRLLARSFFPAAPGGWWEYTAVFAGGYLAGWLALPVPAGLFVREYALALGLTHLGLLPAAEAAVVIVASRLLLTVLEVLPGAAFLAHGAFSRSSVSTDVSP